MRGSQLSVHVFVHDVLVVTCFAFALSPFVISMQLLLIACLVVARDYCVHGFNWLCSHQI